MNRKVLLLEPNYKNKYPPMGLMKIASYYRRCGDDVRFFKGDLKDFAARLLCEEFYDEFRDVRLGKYFTVLMQYVRTGKADLLNIVEDNLPDLFQDIFFQDRIRTCRLRYKRYDYPKFDIICITTLFTFYWEQTIDTINYAKNFCVPEGKIFVGGIAATIQPDEIFRETEIFPHTGLLDKPGILDEGNTDIIDELPLDYSILEEIDYEYPSSDAYFGYMTRGCPRRCEFCGVPQLEPEYKNYISIKSQIMQTENKFGMRKDLLLMDNNVLASEYFAKIIDEIQECGFQKNAVYQPSNEYDIAVKNLRDEYNTRGYTRKIIKLYDKVSARLPEKDAGEFYIQREKRGLLYPETAAREAILKFDSIFRPLYESHIKTVTRSRHIDFNQGIDARLVTDEKMRMMSKINISPLRIAFDHYEQRDIYCNAVKIAASNGIKNMSNYLLYNFHDKPEELYYRLKINIDLCEELGITIYSFPMKFHPLNDPKFFRNREYTGIHWNKKFIRAVQAILNSTKGKIGRGVTFFEQAFGRNIDEFYMLLWMPETFIIFRRKYDAELRSRLSEKYNNFSKDDCDLANEWWQEFISMPEAKLIAAKNIISSNNFNIEIDDIDISHLLSYYKIPR